MSNEPTRKTRVFMSTRSVWSKPNTRKRFSGYVTRLVARGTRTTMYESSKRETWLGSRALARKYLESERGTHLQLTDPASGDVMGTAAHAERDNLEHDPVDGRFKRELLNSEPKLDVTRPAPMKFSTTLRNAALEAIDTAVQVHSFGIVDDPHAVRELTESEAIATLNGWVPIVRCAPQESERVRLLESLLGEALPFIEHSDYTSQTGIHARIRKALGR